MVIFFGHSIREYVSSVFVVSSIKILNTIISLSIFGSDIPRIFGVVERIVRLKNLG